MMTKFVLMVSLILAGTGFSYAQNNCTKGKEALDKGDFIQAASLLREGVRKDKKNAQCYAWLGQALLGADSADQAVAVLIQARELDPTNAQTYVLLGDAYTKQKIYAAAIPFYSQALELDSTNAGILKKLAGTYLTMRQYNEAATAYLRAIARDTTDLTLRRDLISLYVRANLCEKALPFQKFVVEREPNSLDDRLQFIECLYETRRYEELIPNAQTVLSHDSLPNDSLKGSVLRMLGVSYAKMRDYAGADSIFSQLEGRGGLGAQDYLELGKAQKALDKVDESIASFEKAVQLDSTLHEGYYELGTLYMKKKEWDTAHVNFDKKIAADTTANYQWASHLNATVCLTQLKRWEEARVHVLQSIQIRPENLQGWQNLALIYAQMDSSKLARETYGKVEELILADTVNTEKNKSALEEAYRMQGFYHLIDKKFQAAIDNLRKSLAMDSKNCQTLIWIAQAYHNSNNKEEATRHYCRLIQQCPKNAKLVEDAKAGLALLGTECK